MNSVKIIYGWVFLFMALVSGCQKMNYTVDPDGIPFRMFTKGKYWGVLNTDMKEIIIPANYQYIEQIIITENYPWKADEIFYLVENKGYSDIRNTEGEIIFVFPKDEFMDSFFEYKKKHYVITNRSTEIENEWWDEVGSHSKDNKRLYLIEGKSAVELIASTEIKHLGKGNLIYFSDYFYYSNEDDAKSGYFDLNTHKRIAFDAYDPRAKFYINIRNEVWIKEFDKEQRKSEPYYDFVLDSTLNIKENTFKKVFKLYKEYFLTETETGIQLFNYDGTAAPFVYPHIETVKNRVTRLDDYHLNKILDKLFVYSNEKEAKKIGIIGFEGNIILPAEYDKISILKINYPEQPSEEFRNFIKENKLDQFYYFTTKDENQKYDYSIFNIEGNEIFSAKNIDSEIAYLKFNFSSDPPEIQLYTRDSIRNYDLKSGRLERTESRESK
ncbi:MAG: hypothetical protein WBF83_11225 [Moheibacter sp.]